MRLAPPSGRRGAASAPARVTGARPAHATGERGLTLLELLVAMAIFAVIGGALYGTFARAAAGRDYALERGRAYAAARSILDRIERDLAGSFVTGEYGQTLKRFAATSADLRETFAENTVVLDFTAIDARGASPTEIAVVLPGEGARGDQARILYELREDTTLVRYEIRPPRPEEIDLELVTPHVIAEGVAALGFRFFDGEEWLETWDSGQPGARHDAAPKLIETTLVLEAGDGAPVELVSAVLVPLGGKSDRRRRG